MAYIRIIETNSDVDKESLIILFSKHLAVSLSKAKSTVDYLFLHGEIIFKVKNVDKFYNESVLEKESKKLGLEIEIDMFQYMLSFEDFKDTVINDMEYYYKKFQNGDCDPSEKELIKLENCLNEIRKVRDNIKQIYENH